MPNTFRFGLDARQVFFRGTKKATTKNGDGFTKKIKIAVARTGLEPVAFGL